MSVHLIETVDKGLVKSRKKYISQITLILRLGVHPLFPSLLLPVHSRPRVSRFVDSIASYCVYSISNSLLYLDDFLSIIIAYYHSSFVSQWCDSFLFLYFLNLFLSNIKNKCLLFVCVCVYSEIKRNCQNPRCIIFPSLSFLVQYNIYRIPPQCHWFVSTIIMVSASNVTEKQADKMVAMSSR